MQRPGRSRVRSSILVVLVAGTIASQVLPVAAEGGWTTPPPPPHPGSSAGLSGAWALSGSNAWAVGYANDGKTDHTLVLHWNGNGWHRQSSPDGVAGSGDLQGVFATSASDAWAVGH